MRPGLVLAVAAGGAAGTLVRAGVAQAVPPTASGFPWATFAVNGAGSLILGLAVVAALERGAPSPWFRPLVGTGFCGGMTTFSTFLVEIDLLMRAGRVGVALGYLTASVVVGLAATRAGMLLARRVR